MEMMSIGMCLDHIQEYADLINPKKEKVREATQEDINRLKGR